MSQCVLDTWVRKYVGVYTGDACALFQETTWRSTCCVYSGDRTDDVLALGVGLYPVLFGDDPCMDEPCVLTHTVFPYRGRTFTLVLLALAREVVESEQNLLSAFRHIASANAMYNHLRFTEVFREAMDNLDP